MRRYREGVRASAALAYEHHPGTRGRLEAALLAFLSAGGFPYLLNRMDKDAMAHSIETRLPFLDHEVIALALNLPLEARVRPDPKGVLRDVASRHLPPAIVTRAKQLGLQVGAQRIERAARLEFLQHGVLRDLLRESASSWDALRRRTGARDRVRLWTAEIWCRLFLEGESVRRVETELWNPERV